MTAAAGPVEGADLAPTRDVLERLFVASRTVASHGGDHPLALQAAGAVADAVAAAGPPFALQFVAGGVFRDRVLVALEPEPYERAMQVGAALEALSAQELAIERPLSRDDALQLARVLASSALRRAVAIDDVPPHVRLRDIPNARHGLESEAIPPDVAAVAQVALATASAETLAAHLEGPWPWDTGLSTVRRLDAALARDPVAATRAIELAAGAWSPARQGAAAALLTLDTLACLGVSRPARRAAAHAALGLAVQGLRARGGLATEAAADALVPRMAQGGRETASGPAPHRLQTVAIVHLLSTVGRARGLRLRVARLVELAYALERMRRPEDLAFDLSRSDLFARAARRMGADLDEAWTCVVTTSLGVLPPGACVQVPDGRLGVVIGPSPGDTSRLQVLVGGTTRELEAPLRLVAPHERILRGGAG